MRPLRATIADVVESLAPPIPADLRETFADEATDTNLRRLKLLLPLMAALHAVHVAHFWPSAAELATLSPTIAEWRTAVADIHAVTLVVVLLLVPAAYFARGRVARLVAPLVGLTYMLHAAAIVGADQLNVTSVTPYIGYSLGVAVMLSWSPVELAVMYGAGVTAFVASITTMQHDAVARQAILPNGPSVTLVSVVLAILLRSARRRDFVQRVTIQRQRDELARLNAGLEQRVREQVTEIVARAQELDRLNAQLRAQVRTQSVELAEALNRLAAKRRVDLGSLRGHLLADRFEIEELIGAGGMGAVYAAFDRVGRSRVAVKVVQARSAAHLDALRRFLREAATAASVLHPGVVRMLHVDVTEDGLFFQVQELVDGETLRNLLARMGRLEATFAARIGAELFDALAAAHERGVVHRDVKPANVMLIGTPPGIKLVDFGISKLDDDPVSSGDDATGTGALLGTPAFMSPEQLADGSSVDGATDVYAAGITLYLLLAGRHPFDDSSLRGMMANHARGEARDVRELEPSVPAELAGLVARCVARDPTRRPTAREASDALAAFADARDERPLDVLVRERAIRGAGPLDGGSGETFVGQISDVQPEPVKPA